MLFTVVHGAGTLRLRVVHMRIVHVRLAALGRMSNDHVTMPEWYAVLLTLSSSSRETNQALQNLARGAQLAAAVTTPYTRYTEHAAKRAQASPAAPWRRANA